MCEHYVELWRVCVRVPLLLTGPESTYRETSPHFYTPSLSPQLQATILPLFHCSSYSACLSQRCTTACLRLLPSRGFQQCWRWIIKPSHLWDKFILNSSWVLLLLLYFFVSCSFVADWNKLKALLKTLLALSLGTLFCLSCVLLLLDAPQVAGSSVERQRETWGDFLSGLNSRWKAKSSEGENGGHPFKNFWG